MTYWKVAKSAVELPCKPGVYVLYRDGKPYYVGASWALKDRFWTHHLQPKDTIKYKVSQKCGDWLMWEFRLIENLGARGLLLNKMYLRRNGIGIKELREMEELTPEFTERSIVSEKEFALRQGEIVRLRAKKVEARKQLDAADKWRAAQIAKLKAKRIEGMGKQSFLEVQPKGF